MFSYAWLGSHEEHIWLAGSPACHLWLREKVRGVCVCVCVCTEGNSKRIGSRNGEGKGRLVLEGYVWPELPPLLSLLSPLRPPR